MPVIQTIEAWLSLVERCVRDAEVAGSNPVASTKKRSSKDDLFFVEIIEYESLKPHCVPNVREGAEGAACRWHAFSTDRAGRRDRRFKSEANCFRICKPIAWYQKL